MLDRTPARRPSANDLRENFGLMFRLSSIICEEEPFDRSYAYLDRISPVSLSESWSASDLRDYMSRHLHDEASAVITSLAADMTSSPHYLDSCILGLDPKILFLDSRDSNVNWNRAYDDIVIDICIGRHWRDLDDLIRYGQYTLSNPFPFLRELNRKSQVRFCERRWRPFLRYVLVIRALNESLMGQIQASSRQAWFSKTRTRSNYSSTDHLPSQIMQTLSFSISSFGH